MRQVTRAGGSAAVLLAVLSGAAVGQEVGRGTAPLAGAWQPLESLGQPPRWKPSLQLGFGVRGSSDSASVGPTAALGVYRDLFNPVIGALGVGAYGYVGQRGDLLDVGGQLLLESPAFFVHGGLDWNVGEAQPELVLGATFPVRRGGWLGRGDQLRIEWVPRRENSVQVAATIPLRQPHLGRTRPRHVDVELPPSPQVSRRATPLNPATRAAVADVAESMQWLIGLHQFFWLMDPASLNYERSVARSRQTLRSFQQRMVRRGAAGVHPYSYARETEHYHNALERAFGLALDAVAADAGDRGRALADHARRVTLEEVVLPYNRVIGQYRQPDDLRGLTARARARFIAWHDLERGERPPVAEVVVVLDAWLDQLEELRRQTAALTRDSRTNWLPLALVLRSEEHETQRQIDAIIGAALGRDLLGGNATLYIDGLRFQGELARTVRETERYHVLWIHDYRGRDATGQPDRTGYAQTVAYLRALLEGVRRFDERGYLPAYFLVLDQYYYEINDARLWLDLLERPLTHRLRLPPGSASLSHVVQAYQDSLRQAIAASAGLRAAAVSFGTDWIEQAVKVHVNITNPSDPSFRSRRLLGPPIGGDNLMRDHRKVVIRDVTEADPSRGEVILAGVGVGEHYATPTWDDRALILQGPAAVDARVVLRSILERHGLEGARLPAPLRAEALATDHGEQVRRLEAMGATARVLQVYNRTGWGEKEATFVQMLLYDLVPAGTVLYVPDSLWTSYQWMAQLVSAALRGCEVIVVAPALANAPSAGFPQMSVMQELVTRLVLVQEEMGATIAAAGGALRVGLFAQRTPREDLPGLLAAVAETYERHAFLQRLFPYTPEVRALIDDVIRTSGARVVTTGAEPPVERVPQMHRKTQLIASAHVLETLATSPQIASVLREALATITAAGTDPPHGMSVTARARAAPQARLFDLVPGNAAGAESVLYFMTGSMNKNVRSMALDGEAQALLAGVWALQAYLDFALLSGSVVWVSGLSDVEALLPPFSSFQRWIGRLLEAIL